MAKITNKQTRPTAARVYHAGDVAIQTNAQGVAALDYDARAADTAVEFTALFNGLTVDEFRDARSVWLEAYAAAMGCAKDSAGARFAEMVRATGVVKPQSERAQKVQAARAAAKSAIQTAAETDPKAGAADKALAKVKMELSSIEAHIVSLIRAGKFTQAAQAVADLAGATV